MMVGDTTEDWFNGELENSPVTRTVLWVNPLTQETEKRILRS